MPIGLTKTVTEEIVIDPNIKFLVVTNFPIMQRIAQNLLKECGFTNVQYAVDGEDGLFKLRADSFDFVVTDRDMRNMTGLDMLCAIRADPALKHLPVLMVMNTGASRENITEAAQAGANGYFSQPFTAGNFSEKLNKIFQAMNCRPFI